MSGNSTWDNAFRMLKERKANIYTEVSNDAAKEVGLTSNPITRNLNDPRDAFRHTYSSALMAYNTTDTISKWGGNLNEYKNHVMDAANQLSTTGKNYISAVSALAGKSEEGMNNPPAKNVKPEEEWMDYYNNQKGREIAEQVKARGGNEEDIKQEVAKAVSDNRLVLTPFDPRRTFDEHGDFELAVKESEQQMVDSWNRDMTDIANNRAFSADEKQEERRKLNERYQEYERQFNQLVEKQRASKSNQVK